MRMAQREKLPSKDFALPGKGTGKGGKGPGSYPIDTKGRARSALSRASANASPAAEIKRKIAKKFPSIAVGGRKSAGGGEREGGRRMVTVPASRSAAKARRGR